MDDPPNTAVRNARTFAWPYLLLSLFLACAPCSSSAGDSLDGHSTLDAAAKIREDLNAARFNEAELLAREHLTDVADLHGERSLQYAQTLDLLVEAMLGGGKALEDETERLARQAVQLKERLSPDGSPELGYSLVVLGQLYFDRGEMATATDLLRRGLQVQEAAVGPDDVVLIRTLRILGNALLGDGNLAGAEEAYRREGELIAVHYGEGHMDAAGHAYNMARFMIEIGDWEQAKLLYQKTADIVEQLEGATNARMAYALLGIGNVQAFLGEATDALETHERALAIARDAFRPDHPFIASCYTGLGFALYSLGDLDGAKKIFSDAMNLAAREYGPEHEATGRALRLLAEVERVAGELDNAEAHLIRARQILSKSENKIPGLEADVEYARLLADRNRIDRAVLQMQVVHDTASESFPDHPDAALWDVTLADLLLRAGRPEESRVFLQEIVERFPEQLGEDDATYVEAHAHLAIANARTGRTGEALELAAYTESLGTDRVRLLIAGLSERRALSAAESVASARDLLLTLAAKQSNESAVVSGWEAVVRSRGAVLDELARRHAAVTKLTGSDAAEEFVVASRRLANLLVHGPSGDIETFQRTIEEAKDRREAAERHLARESQIFRRFQHDRSIGLDQVRKALPEDSALVAYVEYKDLGENASASVGERQYAAFVLSSSGSPRFVRLGPASELEAEVDKTRGLLRVGLLRDKAEQETAYRSHTAKLRKRIWDPIKTACGEASRLFIVPEGVLHLINFATLPIGEDRYLIDSGMTFHYLSAERELAIESTEVSGHGLLVVGDPDYNAKPTATTAKVAVVQPTGAAGPFRGDTSHCPDFRDVLFPRLGQAKYEARSVARHWAAANPESTESAALLLIGENATEGRFKEEASGRRILHLATHGFFLDGQCPGASFEYRGIGGLSPARERIPEPHGENPLVLSGLALAGANYRSQVGTEMEDGILTAEEIAALDLGGAEWIVLSACDTGLGQIRPGEGVFGLRRAFSVAGARTLIMTLWPVRDDVAAEWMNELYAARLGQGMDTAAAVTAATKAVVDRRRSDGLSIHPAVWGAFVASGDWH